MGKNDKGKKYRRRCNLYFSAVETGGSMIFNYVRARSATLIKGNPFTSSVGANLIMVDGGQRDKGTYVPRFSPGFEQEMERN